VAEGGSIVAFVAVLALALLVLLGLVVDGGRAAAAKDAAQADAEQAARFGADQLSVSAARAGEITLDTQASTTAALKFLKTAGLVGSVEVSGLAVTVHIETLEPTVFLGVIGIRGIQVNATASASLVHGVTRSD
jgi:Flp pilus assembly protein TadG